MLTRVVNRRFEPFDVYIGRPTKWGNPFLITPALTRAMAIEKYREHILASPVLMSALPELRGKTLGCWCKPLPCHGDVLTQLIQEQGS